MTIYGNIWYCYHWTSSVNPISPIVKSLCEVFLRAWSTTNLYSNVWWLIHSEFDKLNSSFNFYIKKSIVIPRERSDMGCYLFRWERFSSISCFWDNLCIVTHFDLQLYNVLSTYTLVMLSMSPMNTKTIYGLPEWLQFIYATDDL